MTSTHPHGSARPNLGRADAVGTPVPSEPWKLIAWAAVAVSVLLAATDHWTIAGLQARYAELNGEHRQEVARQKIANDAVYRALGIDANNKSFQDS